ncbi:four helix bundle protein [Algoriphagus boseongensis]|uniref:Four helix bundle protein n=1 Tax=Algoriphagus boseongensis TaxID=1442587 RepID=A0A4R6T804_9BACT|nr:four helix bundle protein [Algoriphagus boseongensis]TDQ17068.1 four helix bundle protein [Algoriphagus boseongensis]
MHNFKELKVWQKSVDLAVKIYTSTKSFPSEEKFGLISQMRRAAVSIPSNIAEGCAKTSSKSFSNSLEVSLGESFELETQMIISEKVGILNSENAKDLESDLSEVQRMIMGLKSSLESKS